MDTGWGGLIRPGGIFMTTQALLILGYTNTESLCACSRVPRVGFLDCNRCSVNKVKHEVESVQHPAKMTMSARVLRPLLLSPVSESGASNLIEKTHVFGLYFAGGASRLWIFWYDIIAVGKLEEERSM